MTLLQHIVAGNTSPQCNIASLPPETDWMHNEVMESDDPNGGPNHLRAWREYRGLSQPELADLIGTSHQVIGYLERGRTQLSAKWLRKLAPALETTPGMLLDHDPHELSGDVIDMWRHASTRQRQQLTEIAKTITRTGTKD